MIAIFCISFTVMLPKLKDFATSMNVHLTGTTPMSTTAASIMPTSTLVPLGLWSVSQSLCATFKHCTHYKL